MKTSHKREFLNHTNAIEPNIKFTAEETRPYGSMPFVDTGGSCLSQIFWEHENLSGLSVLWLIYIELYKEKEKNVGKNQRLSGNLA